MEDSKTKRSAVRFSPSQVLDKSRAGGTNKEVAHTKNCPRFLVKLQIQKDGNIFSFIEVWVYKVQKAYSNSVTSIFYAVSPKYKY